MKLWGVVSRAIVGWQMIIRGDADWRSHFTISLAGLATALSLFALVAFLAVAVLSLNIGMPAGAAVLGAIIVLALPLLSLLIALLATRNFLRSRAPLLPVLVPAVYALMAFLLIEGLLAMIGGPIVMLSWLAMGYLLFRLARLALDWTVGVAVGLAVLTVVLLVAMRAALYMVPNAPL